MSSRGRSSLRTLRAEGRKAGKAVAGKESVGDDSFFRHNRLKVSYALQFIKFCVDIQRLLTT